jgi:hypothetical protein
MSVSFSLPWLYYITPVFGDIPGVPHVMHELAELCGVDSGRIYIGWSVTRDAVGARA